MGNKSICERRLEREAADDRAKSVFPNQWAMCTIAHFMPDSDAVEVKRKWWQTAAGASRLPRSWQDTAGAAALVCYMPGSLLSEKKGSRKAQRATLCAYDQQVDKEVAKRM